MKDIKELKELCVFLALVVTAQQKASADGAINMADVPHLMGPLMALPAALAGVSEIPAEAKDLDPAEAAELSAAIKGALDLNNDNVEAVVEQVLEAALQLAGAALSLKAARAA